MARNRRRTISLLLSVLLALAVIAITPAASLAQSDPQSQQPNAPEISAASAIVVEYPSGRILYQKSAHDRVPPASLTKIMTAILALEYGNLNDVITVAPEDLAGESTMGLVSGEQQTLHDLMYGMLLPSGNDAAMAIARYLGTRLGSNMPANEDPVARFADMMNIRVSQLGLTDTHFVTPHGLDTPGHYSSAYDLASLAWYALHLPTFNEIVKTIQYDAPGHSLLNTNEMLTRYDGADGIKTGWTDGCGLCLVTSATRDGHRLISVVLNAPQWYTDSGALLDYGFASLAATPTDPQAEVLSISKRDTVTYLLANPAAQPPVPPVVQAPAMAKGGGSAAPPAAPVQSVAQTAGSASQPSGGSQGAPDSGGTFPPASTIAAATEQSGSNLLLILAIFAVIAVSCFWLAARRWGLQPAALLPLSLKASGLGQLGPPEREPAASEPLAMSHPPKVAARTLGYMNPARPSNIDAPAGRPFRREPNLLADGAYDAQARIESAVAHAAEGRQGSALGEFVIALKDGARIDVAELAEQYQLSAAAFLALSGAQVAVGNAADARRTLLHGVLVLPGERVLRLALFQLPPSEHD